MTPAPEGVDTDLRVVVTPMRRRHLRAVLRIEHEVYPRPWSMGLYLSELGFGPSRIYLVARIDAHVVGYAGAMVIGDEGHVTTVAVDPAWHRNHIATRLLVQLVRRSVEAGDARTDVERASWTAPPAPPT